LLSVLEGEAERVETEGGFANGNRSTRGSTVTCVTVGGEEHDQEISWLVLEGVPAVVCSRGLKRASERLNTGCPSSAQCEAKV